MAAELHRRHLHHDIADGEVARKVAATVVDLAGARRARPAFETPLVAGHWHIAPHDRTGSAANFRATKSAVSRVVMSWRSGSGPRAPFKMSARTDDTWIRMAAVARSWARCLKIARKEASRDQSSPDNMSRVAWIWRSGRQCFTSVRSRAHSMSRSRHAVAPAAGPSSR